MSGRTKTRSVFSVLTSVLQVREKANRMKRFELKSLEYNLEQMARFDLSGALHGHSDLENIKLK